MQNNTAQKFHLFKIRTISDQRFLASWTVISFVLSVLMTATLAAGIYLENLGVNTGIPVPGIFGVGPKEIPPVPPWQIFGNDKLTFIILGYDEVDRFAHRSDTLMVGAVDFVAKKVNIISIPRDTLVHIPRRGFMKVNAAYALGGDELVRQTVEEFFGVQIDYVVSVNYSGFVEVVDSFGGVDINIERAMNYDDRRGNVHIHLPVGEQHLDGQQALNYARFRHDAHGDLGRIDRQQKLIDAIIEQAIRPVNYSRLEPAAQTFLENIHIAVNENSVRNPPVLTIDHVLSLIGFIQRLEGEDKTFYTIPTDDVIYQGLSCLMPLYTRTRSVLDEVFIDELPVGWDNARLELVTHSDEIEFESNISACNDEDVL